MTLLQAPMEGLLDFVLCDVPTRVGGVDRCVSEFIRITGTLLPDKVFLRYVPELYHGVRLDTLEQVAPRAQLIYQQVVLQKLMPINNATQMTEAERVLIARWYAAGVPVQ